MLIIHRHPGQVKIVIIHINKLAVIGEATYQVTYKYPVSQFQSTL